MITRQGRSASTVSSVLPNSDAPVRRGGSAITIARARISRASSTIRRPPCPGRTFSQCPVTRRPPRTRAESMIEPACASCSGIAASIGEFGGTVISHQHVDAAPAPGGQLGGGGHRPGRVVPLLEGHEHRLVLDLVLDHGLRHHHLVRSR